jgi:UMP-CMP kinase 2
MQIYDEILLFSGKTTLVKNLTERIGAQVFQTPPPVISEYREIMVKQCEPVCRAFYSLGNYLMAEEIKDSLIASPVVLDR